MATAELRRTRHRLVATRRRQVLFLLAAVLFLPVLAGLLRAVHDAGAAVAAGGLDVLVRGARWYLPVSVGLFFLQGALTTSRLQEFGARRLLLSTVPDRTLALGLLVATLAHNAPTVLLPVTLLLGAFALGAGTSLPLLVGTAAMLLLLFTGYLAGVAIGLAGRATLLRVPVASWTRDLVGTVADVAVLVLFGAFGALVGTRAGEVSAGERVAAAAVPGGAPPVPVGYYADWLFVGTPAGRIGVAAVGTGVGLLVTLGLATVAIVRLAPHVWYADRATPDPEDDERDATRSSVRFLDGGVPARVAGRTGVVATVLLRRLARRPQRLVFLGYYLLAGTVLGVGFAGAESVRTATVLGGGAVALGLLLAGAVTCLNPLGEEGPVLPRLLLSATPAMTIVRARLATGVLLGAPLVFGGATVLAATALAPTESLVLGAYWAALLPVSAGAALGIGTFLPNDEPRRLLERVEVRAPATLAIVSHAGLVLALAVAGPLLWVAPSTGLPRRALAASLGLVAVVLGHGGYRYAVRGLADHGRRRTPDPVFAVELTTGLALAGLLLSNTAALGVTFLTGFDWLAGFVTGFLGAYVGWGSVAVAYLLASGRADFLDLRVPTRGDLRALAAGTVALLGLWALVTLGVRLLDLPVTRHVVADGGNGLRRTVALVVLAVAVNGPVEELLFRNVIQKRLAATLDGRLALAVASVTFALVHLPVYATGTAVGVVVPVAMLTALGVGFGLLYRHTGNLVVPALCHGWYNAALFVVVL